MGSSLPTAPPGPARTLRPVARWGLLAVAVALAITLAFTAATGHRNALRVTESLARGRGQELSRTVIEELLHGTVSDELLNGILEEHAEAGLRYVAYVEQGGGRVSEAGERAMRLPDTPRIDWAYDGALGRARVIAALPPSRPGQPPRWPRVEGREETRPPRPPRARPPPPPERRPGGPPGAPPFVVVEFEPLEARALVARSSRALALGSLGAVALTIAALVFVRLSLRADRAEAGLERQRHLARLGEMSAVLAHEIRNPLASLKGQAQLLVESIPDERTRARAEQVVAEAVRLERLTSVLLDFTRTGSVEPAPTPPARPLERAANDTGSGRVRLLVAPDLPERWAMDETRITQVLSNLLANALEASAERATGDDVEAMVGVEGGKLVYTVRDHGPGLPAGEADALFEAFHTTKLNGTGLGLAIARRIVELHGGIIEGANHPGGGAVFRVVLPPS